MIRNILTLAFNDLAVCFQNRSVFLVFFIPVFVLMSNKLMDQQGQAFQRIKLGLIQGQEYPGVVIRSLKAAPGAFDLSYLDSFADGRRKVKNGILDGTLTGGAIGGIGGLILGAGALMIPGIGPIIAAGPIAAALGGAVAGGITGGLIDWGIPAEESQHYEEEVIQGSILAIIRTDSGKVNSVAQILKQNGAKEVKSHSK